MVSSKLVLRIPKGKANINKCAALAASSYFFYETVFEAIGHCCKVFFGAGFWLDNAILLLFAIIGVGPFVIEYLKLRRKKGLILPFFLLVATLISIIFNNELWIYIKPVIFSMLICCFFYIVFQYVDISFLIAKILKQRWILLFLFIVTSLLLINEEYISSAKQVISYNIAVTAVLFMISFCSVNRRELKMLDFCGFFVSLVLLLTMSSRGAFVATLLATGLLLSSTYRKFGFITVLAGIIVLNFEIFLSLTNALLELLHINSRIGYYLTMSNFFVQEGRAMIYDSILNVLNQYHLIGGGICFDRLVIDHSIGIDTYSHNIILEILCQFGWILGSIILFIVLFLYLYPLVKSGVDYKFRILISLFSVRGLICLLFSGSYLITYEFFVLLSLGLTAFRSIHSSTTEDNMLETYNQCGI